MNVKIIEAPIDLGGKRHGSDMGPSAIRLAGIKNKLEELGHKVSFEKDLKIDSQENVDVGTNLKAKYLPSIVDACIQLAEKVENSVENKEFPLILGGDHSIVMGTVAGISKATKKQNKRLGILYIDAHGDFNTTETTETGNIHGECLAACAGYGIKELVNLYYEGQKIDPENICYVGIRDLDKGEKQLMKEAKVTVFTISDIDRLGFSEVVKRVKQFFVEKCDTVHISFDMDALDPSVAPGTGVPVPGGLTYREALLLMEEMSNLNLVNSMEIVEVNPILDDRNCTAIMAVEIATRLLGKKLY